jgi:hypothetical protein
MSSTSNPKNVNKALKKNIGITRKTMAGSTSDGFGKHSPCFTKHRKNYGQFKRKQNHWSQL